MPISNEHKLVMVHIPKNAGTSIEKSLNMQGSGHFKWDKYATQYPKEWKEYKSFAVLRDPVDRFISAFNYATMNNSYWHSSDPQKSSKYGKHIDYDTCIKYDINSIISPWLSGEIKLHHPSWWTQYQWIINDGSVAVEYLALFSGLSEAIEYLAPKVTLKKINKSTSSRSDILNDENKKIILNHYDVDADLVSQMCGKSICRTDGEEL